MRITANPTGLFRSEKAILSRRNFLGLAFTGSLAALVGQGLAATLKFLQPPKVAGFGGLVLAGKVDEFPQGSVTRVMAGRFYILHNQDGLLAVYQKCTHLGCSVPWVEGEGQFHCPCHGSLFNRNGEVTGGPAPRPLEIFRIEIKNGEVWVDTSKPVNRSAYDPGQSVKV